MSNCSVRILPVLGLVFLSLFACGDKKAVVATLYGTEASGDEQILLDQEAELDGTDGPERIVVVAGHGSERLGLLDFENNAWAKATALDFSLRKVPEKDTKSEIAGARVILRVTRFATGADDPESVLVEYLSEDPAFESPTRQIFVFTRLARTFDSLVVSGFAKYADTVRSAGGIPYAVKDGSLVLFPESPKKTDLLELRFNGRSFNWLHDDGPFFYIYPLEARHEGERLKGTFKIINRGQSAENARVFLDMPAPYRGPGALRDLVLFEPKGRWKKDETRTFDFDTRFPKEPPLLLLRIVAGKKDDYEFPAEGESADRVVKNQGDRYYAVPVTGL